MPPQDPAAKPGFKQKAGRELKELVIIFAYLAFFFCALITYTSLELRKYEINYLSYSFAIINALVIAKVILIGDMVGLGKRVETRPLYQSVLLKSILFSLLVLAFHFLEEFVKRLIHHQPFGTVWHETHWDELIARSIIIFLTFIPLFAFTELRRVLGEDKIYALFRAPGVTNPTP
jgi:hypothetical protein